MENEKYESLILVGCKSCGKSTQGQALAQKLGVDFYDIDNVIEEMVGMSVRDFYSKRGAIQFMLAEEEACKKVVAECGTKKIVISTGGGICDNAPALLELKAKGKFVFLKIDTTHSVERIMSRIEETEPGKFSNVPAYIAVKKPSSLDEIRSMLLARFEERTNLYSSIADITVDIKNAPQEENFKSIFSAINS